DSLCEDGLVIECRLRTSKWRHARPRYMAATADADAPETQDAYLGLSELLLGVLVGDRDPDDVGRLAGRLIGGAVVRNDSSAHQDAAAQFERFLESRGFRPKRISSGPDIAFVLGCCPFEE